MSSRDWKLRVGDILSAIADIEQWTAGKTLNEFEEDRILGRNKDKKKAEEKKKKDGEKREKKDRKK